MVITIIAILALLILPLFRDRVEAARRAAVQDEIMSLATAECLAFADTHYFFRFQDLDNTTLYNDPPNAATVDVEVPIAQWNRAFEPEDRTKLRAGSTQWKGPYISLAKYRYLTVDEARNAVPEFFWDYAGRGGPIMIIPPGAAWANSLGWFDSLQDKILIDPWGTPYLFFGTGRLNEEGGVYAALESDFGNAAIYSLGPDGMPGNSVPYTPDPNQQNLLREFGVLGTGDDYFRIL